jgi:putative molybdopterin biosynthesis protein
VVVNLFRRDIGFLVAAKNPLGIHGFEDLSRKDVRFINRQKGAGTRVLLDYYLKKLRIPSSEIKGYEKEVYTHLEVGISILSKESDVGIGTIAVSKFFGLSFIPITTESFDMILNQTTFFEKGVQTFMEILNSVEFRKRVSKLGNYDFKNSGKILYSRN